MHPGYSLKVEEYRHPHEPFTRYIYMGVAVVGIVLMMIWSIPVVISVIITLAFAFLTWIIMLRSAVAKYVRVSPTQFPEIYQLSVEAARRLDIPLPKIFVQQSPIINAYATGFGKSTYQVILTTATIDAMSSKELQFIIGHEMGHIKSNHVIYSLITSQLLSGNPLLFIFSWIQLIFRYALTFMSRVNEYTADRAGLIGCGNIYYSISALTKLAIGKEMFERINLKEYFRQIEEFSNNKLNALTELDASHPFTVNRLRGLAHFYKSSDYQTIKMKLGEGGTSILQEPIQGTMHLLDKIADKYHTPQINQMPQNQQVPVYSQVAQYVQTPVSVPAPSHAPPPQTTTTCSKCHSQNRPEAAFCFNCGNRMR